MNFKKIIFNLNYKNNFEFFLKYLLPIILLSAIFALSINFFFESFAIVLIGNLVSFLILVAGISYPFLKIEENDDLDDTIPYFITYAGALSTIEMPRKDFFKDLSLKKEYVSLSKVFEKLLYLTQKIKLDFSTACYKLASITENKDFSKFLERMGISLYFNSNKSDFFIKEQKALMQTYSSFFKESFSRLASIREAFSSLNLSISYFMGIIFLLPFVTGIDIAKFMKYSILVIIVIDVILIYFIRSSLPKDEIYITFKREELTDIKKIKGHLFLYSPVFFSIIIILYFAFKFPILVCISVASLPLIYIGYLSNKLEAKIDRKDSLFTSFIRSFGDIHNSKGGTLTTTLENLIPHNFGDLNSHLKRLYKRLKTSSSNTLAFTLFSKEIGSNLIIKYLDTFIVSIKKGGNPKVIGDICSENMNEILGLRGMKKEHTKTFRNTIYAGFFGFCLTVFLCLKISQLLTENFLQVSSNGGGQSSVIGDLFSVGQIDFTAISFFISIFIIVHSIFCSYIIKEVEGGNRYGAVFHFAFLIILSATMEIIIDRVFSNIFNFI